MNETMADNAMRPLQSMRGGRWIIAAALLILPPTAAAAQGAGVPEAALQVAIVAIAQPDADAQTATPEGTTADVPGFRGLPARWHGPHVFGVVSCVLAGTHAGVGAGLLIDGAYRDSAAHEGPAAMGAVGYQIAGVGVLGAGVIWGVVGLIHAIVVEGHRSMDPGQEHAERRTGVQLQIRPGQLQLRF